MLTPKMIQQMEMDAPEYIPRMTRAALHKMEPGETELFYENTKQSPGRLLHSFASTEGLCVTGRTCYISIPGEDVLFRGLIVTRLPDDEEKMEKAVEKKEQSRAEPTSSSKRIPHLKTFKIMAELLHTDKGQTEIAKEFRVSKQYVHQLVGKMRKAGILEEPQPEQPKTWTGTSLT